MTVLRKARLGSQLASVVWDEVLYRAPGVRGAALLASAAETVDA
jgi:hypothetical protein